jgi:hypothetical protein
LAGEQAQIATRTATSQRWAPAMDPGSCFEMPLMSMLPYYSPLLI